MNIRIISDLHIDINKDYPIEINDSTFTIIAGDIAGNITEAENWIKQNIKHGLFIRGNHDGIYCDLINRSPLNAWLIPDLQEKFPIDADISFLENQYKIIDDIVFIGCTLYTDYKYGGNQYNNMIMANTGLNDFRYGMWFDEKTHCLTPLQPQHYLKLHEKSRRFISKTLKKFKDKKCVLITHHGMSPKCIADEYVGNYLNASYVSDMERLIKSNPNLVLVVSGHIHVSKDFMIGNTRYIMNSYGYRNPAYGTVNTAFNPNLIVSI